MNINNVLAAEGGSLPSLQLKITAFMPAELVTRITGLFQEGTITMKDFVEGINRSEGANPNFAQMTDVENEALMLGMRRLLEIGYKAKISGVKLLIDAEYTYMNPGISAIALAMMLALNKNEAVVANTYQCYLKKAMGTLKQEIEIVLGNNCCFGAKIVRGAYMEKERAKAKAEGYPDPVNDSYEDTGKLYDEVIRYMMETLIKDDNKEHYLVVASHNQESLFNAIEVMKRNKIEKASEKVVFGQIFGMGEQISMPLANAGYLVYKSVPYGPLHELLPYLSRRAAESRVILQTGARKEKQLLLTEVSRRIRVLNRN